MSTVLVVGADKGIAHSISRQLHDRGEDVIAACLFDGADLAAAGITVEPGVDVTSQESVEALAARLSEKGVKLDAVFHVAGVMWLDEVGSLDYDLIREQIEINTLGPLRTIEAVRPLLNEGAKVGIVTSRVGSLGDNTSGGMYSYRISKAAANMVGLNLHHDLSKDGVSVLLLHPGMVATDLTKDFPGEHSYITPEQAAAGLIKNIDNLTPETSGRFQHSDGTFLQW
ncbi:1-hydroxy-2-glutathionyl-2-methyl-3-butene dehydrogenase [Rhodococcus sp. ACPA4]|uniref:1-hydroxy-2-glutathionyl-2-methyl-3-butene dehydrogenase n=1 Tax=Rhodococcus sp. ACPA4 TaxID=2028571 RepID=UPI000BB0FDD7|nr:SDR family oxidoreductase [Rhodococcus sp. ACPA4]PBC35847.1 1-hydroxy-2-glutathionyl-2-methyl-3-butene dehydrogenase [Rhodococcus sp. ACPA4]PBC35855.1 1-hydroxy-2-glutathionyl-2-methyl-3-butene dehydrogenase [Rhodococcus sp. ACPA4]